MVLIVKSRRCTLHFECHDTGILFTPTFYHTRQAATIYLLLLCLKVCVVVTLSFNAMMVLTNFECNLRDATQSPGKWGVLLFGISKFASGLLKRMKPTFYIYLKHCLNWISIDLFLVSPYLRRCFYSFQTWNPIILCLNVVELPLQAVGPLKKGLITPLGLGLPTFPIPKPTTFVQVPILSFTLL